MSGFRTGRGLFLGLGLFLSLSARADLYEASRAYDQKDFTRSFELYRELAELGQPEAQENLAVMYVNGEGVARNNVLGYAWAALVLGQGKHEAAQGIVDQLSSHLSDAARAKATELKAQFGMDALRQTILPPPRDLTNLPVYPPPKCAMKTPANPDDYYPSEAITQNISGNVLIEAKIFGDGRAHDPRAEYSLPDLVFEAAGRAVSLNTGFAPAKENGVVVPCSMRFKVKFTVRVAGKSKAATENLDDLRKAAGSGDPRSQFLYALFLENGGGLNPEHEDVVQWFLKAAQAGLPVAQFKVGQYLMPLGSPANDQSKAAFWLGKAASAGNTDAQVMLANYYLRDMSNSVEVGKAAALLEVASAKSLEARFHLAALRSTHPDASIRSSKRALELAGRGFSSFDANPIAFEIRAAIQAGLGDFAGAQKDQAKAVGMAKKLHWNTAPQEVRLAEYQANRTWTGDLFAFY